MNKLFILLLIALSFSTILQAQVAKTINVTAGNLYSSLTEEERLTITSLTLTGTIDARDFKTMRDNMPLLAELDIKGVNIVEYNGVEGCSTLRNTKYAANKIPETAFVNKNGIGKFSLTTINLPSSITSIGYNSFSCCYGLSSISIPPLVTNIDRYAFYKCLGMTSVLIPESVKTIQEYAFYKCSGLTSIIAESSIPPDLYYLSYVFSDVDLNSCTLHVPYGTTSRYASANLWRDFKNIVEPTHGFLLSSTTAKLTSTAGSKATLNITANVELTAISDQFWLTVNQEQSTDGKILTFTAQANVSSFIRRATVTVSAANSEPQFIVITQDGSNLILNISPGDLASKLTTEELQTVTHLTLTGTMDARDFKTLRDQMPLLAELDLGDVTIAQYTGSEGTYVTYGNFPANSIPDFSFYPSLNNNNSSVSSIVLPKLLSQINGHAFGYKLASLTMDYPVPPIVIDQWTIDSNCTLYVPYGAAHRYKIAEKWKEFANIVEAAKGFHLSNYQPTIAGEEGSTITIDINSNVEWTVTSNQDWLEVSPNSGNNNQTLTFKAKANPLFAARTAIVTIYGQGVSPQTITVIQNFQIQPLKTLEVTPGALSTLLNADELNTISKLTLTGSIDARDFKTLRDKMPVLAELDLRGARIVAYNGNEGTYNWSGNMQYDANTIPVSAFSFYNHSDGKYYGKASLISVIIPTTTITIDDSAFLGCQGLTSFYIPSSITSIKSQAFRDCTNLNSIDIPSSVNYIDGYVYLNCVKLTSITLNWSIPLYKPSNYYNIFDGFDKMACTLYVPYGTSSRYAIANQWKEFKNIKEMPGFMPSAFVAEVESMQGSTSSVTINSDVLWTASTDQQWLTVSPAEGTGLGQKLTFTAEANPAYIPRVAKVTVSSPDKESQIITITQLPAPAKVDITAGGLASAFTEEDLKNIKDLTINGTIDARDFKTMRDRMPSLTKLDISNANIIAYTGQEGTNSYRSSYYANTIPETAFYNKTGLTSLLLPKSITSIEMDAFNQCGGLTNMIIPEGVTKLDRNTFYQCKGLQTVTLPSSIISLGRQCFAGCSNLTSLTVESSIPPDLLLSYDVFYKINYNLCVLNVPYASKQNYRSAYQWDMFGNVSEAANGFSIGSNKETVAGTAESKAAVTVSANIAWSASSDQEWLTVDPSSGSGNQSIILTAQANPSFTATRMAIVTVSTTLPGIPSQKITITQNIHPQPPKTLELTPGGLVSALTADELATVTDLTITGTMDARDFKTMRDKMPLLSKINLSAATVVAYNGTEGTSHVGHTDYPANTIPEYAFVYKTVNIQGKRSITSITLPESLTAMGAYAFSDCINLTNVLLPSLVTTIGNYAFLGCTGFSNIIIPPAVTTIGIQALGALNCTIEVDAANPNYMSSNNILFNKAQTELIQCVNSNSGGNYEIPSTVTMIDDYAFYFCRALKSVYIPSSVTSIGKYAFYSCYGLTTLNIPSSVNFIGEHAFEFCYALESIYARSTVPINLDASPNVFNQSHRGTLYVPVGSKAAYQAANQWKIFWNIVENNSELIASAGSNIHTEEGKTVILEGSVLTNTSGKPLTYQWTAPEGVTLSSTTELRPTFTAPDAPYDLTYTFSLIVSDGTIQSLADEVLVFVRNINKVPVSNAGPDQTVNEETLVTLDGSASYDPDNNTLRYEWTAPAGIVLSATNTSQPFFTAPQVAKDTVFTISLLVSDSNNYTTDKVSITVKNINKAPTANAGADQMVNEGTLVTLDGSSSFDPENDALSYRWTVPKGILLSSETESKPSFTAPKVVADSILIFSLIVSDGSSSSLADEVAVTVKNINHPPVAVAGDLLYSAEGAMVTLDATLSSDPDGDALTYLWTAPAGITLSSQTASMPTFTAPAVQSDTWLTFTLVVSDGKLSSSPSEVKVLIQQIDPILGLISKANFLTQPVPVNYRLFKKVDNSFVQQIDTLSATGDSVFIHLELGEWIVLVSSVDNPSAFVSTYAGDVSNWNEAEIITVPDRTTVLKVINCIMPPSVNLGTGQIAGYIYEKPGDGTKSISIAREENMATANPVKTALVQLYKKGGTIPVASVLTDEQGYYKFDQLEISAYEIQVEIPSYVQSERFPVLLSNTAPATKIWFAVNTTLQVITDNNTVKLSMVKAFPNPTSGWVTISGLTGISRIAVYAMNGKLILQKETTHIEESVDLTSQVAGTYILVINEQRLKVYKK